MGKSTTRTLGQRIKADRMYYLMFLPVMIFALVFSYAPMAGVVLSFTKFKSTSLDGRKYDIACGQIDIGNAHTELAARMADGVPQANGTIAVEPLMDVEHVGNAILHMANLPLDTNVQFMTIMATKMPFVGRG